jgi:cyclic beta-1,2-glucan synthetase
LTWTIDFRTMTGDRTDFLGRNGTLRAPAAMMRIPPFRKVGGRPRSLRRDPGERSSWPTGQEREIIFQARRGPRPTMTQKPGRVAFVGRIGCRRDALEAVWQYWKHTLGAVNVETPDHSLNVLANGWLLYQTLACRFWARSAILPVGWRLRFPRSVAGRDGAYPRRAAFLREHLLLCASRQFRKAMSSIGGIPQRAEACARTVRMITSGCRSRRAVMFSPRGIPECWMKPSASSKAAR